MSASSEWTDEVRWHDLARSAVILGIVPSTDKANMLKLNALLEERIAKGLVRKRKEGTAQSAPAWYQGKKEE